jgi:hypothetical protein
MQTGPDDGGSAKKAEVVDKAIKSVPKGISAKDAQALKDVRDGKK